MKHILFLIGLFLFQNGVVKATDTPLPTSYLQTFYSRFADASDVRWEQQGKLTVASFFLYGKKLFAYYNDAAELMLVAEPVSVNELPAALKDNLQKKFCKYTVSELFRLKGGQSTSYHVIFETEKEKVFAKSSSLGWEVQKYVFK